MAKRNYNKATARTLPAWVQVLFVLAFFLLVCLCAMESIKVTALVMMCLTLIVGAVCWKTLRERMGLVTAALILMTAMAGISTFYAISGKFALQSFLFLMASLCGALLLLLMPGRDEAPGRSIATVLEGATALISLISIDMVSTRWISGPILRFLGRRAEVFIGQSGVEKGVRITSMLENPNIFAGCVGIGVLLALGLVLSAQGKKERRVHLCCLYVNALGFVLAFSMGATAAIMVGFVIYLLLERKERRGELLILMIETFVLVLLGVVPVSMTALNGWNGFQPVPLLCAILGCVLLCLADRFVGGKAADKLRGRGRVLLIIVVALIAVLAAAVTVACTWTGGAQIGPDGGLRRAAYPESGDYTVEAVGGEGVRVRIESQNQQDTMMHTFNVLYEGELEQAAFTVPGDSLVVYFNFSAQQDTLLEQVECVGAADRVSVPLGYKLLPGFIATRLQGLLANQNAIQRVVFFRDGMKLFAKAPLFGSGVGSFETAIFSVQEFFYETKHVHNHYIQTLLENGVVGLILFVGLLVLSAAAILRSRRKETSHPMTAALGALLVFMVIHAGVEVVFSSCFYLPLAFGAFALIERCCGESLSVKWMSKAVRSGILVFTAVFTLVFGVLLGCNMAAYSMVQNNPTYENFDRAVKMDKFEWGDYALSYVMTSIHYDSDPATAAQAEQYARKLDKVQSNQLHYYLAMYYFDRGDVETAMEMAMKHARLTASNSEDWNALFELLAQFRDDSPEFQTGVKQLVDFMEQWDADNMGTIELNEFSQEFLEQMSAQ